MRISTVIPVYNAEATLRRAVESLLATRDPDLEIVLVDDGSRDGSRDVAQALQQEHSECVRTATHPGGENRGVSATRNLGIEISSGEWLALLDADDYVHPYRFLSARTILSQKPEIDGVYQLCALEFADDHARECWWNEKTTFGFDRAIDPVELIFELLRSVCWATSAIVFRRSLLQRTGGFDPRLKLAEDCHLWFRMAMAGTLAAGDLSQPVSVYWRHGDSAHQPSPELRIPMIRAMTSFRRWMLTHCPHDPRVARVSRQIAEYILQGISTARTGGHRQLAWQIALESACRYAPLVTYRRWYGHVARMALGR